jgi:hypothetical protein
MRYSCALHFITTHWQFFRSCSGGLVGYDDALTRRRSWVRFPAIVLACFFGPIASNRVAFLLYCTYDLLFGCPVLVFVPLLMVWSKYGPTMEQRKFLGLFLGGSRFFQVQFPAIILHSFFAAPPWHSGLVLWH